MSLLLDTHALHWLATGDERLSPGAKSAISASVGDLWVSSISALELALHETRGKLTFPVPFPKWWQGVLDHHGIRDLPVDWRIAADAPFVGVPHKDPFDRLIVATALRQRMKLVTKDENIHQCPGLECVW